MCKAGAFREDLYYRLSIIHVTLPALRDRRDEIPLLIEYLRQRGGAEAEPAAGEIVAATDELPGSYEYPGNIRELRNIIFRISCLAAETADVEHLPENVRARDPRAPPRSPNRKRRHHSTMPSARLAMKPSGAICRNAWRRRTSE